MDKNQILQAVKEIKAKGPKREFSQIVDLSIKLKGIDLKKPEHKVDFFLTLPYSKGKDAKICGLMDKLAGKAKETFDFVVTKDDFEKYKNKKLAKKLAREYDFFVAQAELMSPIATIFGKYFGPKGKMPNPKAGCVVPPTIQDLKPLALSLRKGVKVATRNETAIKVPVGNEQMKDEEIAANVEAVYNNLLPKLPQGEANIGAVMLKLTMGPFYKVGIGFKETTKVETIKEKKK